MAVTPVLHRCYTMVIYTRVNSVYTTSASDHFGFDFNNYFCNNGEIGCYLPKISFCKSNILFCFNGVYQWGLSMHLYGARFKRLIPLGVNLAYVLERSDNTFASPHGASGADTPYHRTLDNRYTGVTQNIV